MNPLDPPHRQNWWEVYSKNHPNRSSLDNPEYHLDLLKTNNQRVKKARLVAATEIWVKRIGFIAVLAINLALLAGVGLLIYFYTPSFLPTISSLPIHALIASPFIGGVIAALLSLKITKFGGHSSDFKNYTNPVSLMGRAMTLVLFGPLLYLKYKIDWRDYSDPYVVNVISFDLGTKSLEEITLKYGRSISSLKRSGIITSEEAVKLKSLTEQFKPLIKKQNFFKAVWGPEYAKEDDSGSARMHTTEEKEVGQLEKEWKKYRKKKVKNRAFVKLAHPGKVRCLRQNFLGG